MHLKPRKIPLQSRSKATFDAFIEATACILETDGLDAVTTNAVAKRAGYGIASLYQYFPSKHALLAALLHREREFLLAEVVNAANIDGFDEAMDALLKAAVRHQLQRPKLAAALEYVEVLLPVGEETRRLNDQLLEHIALLFEAHGVVTPRIAAQDITIICRALADDAGRRGDVDKGDLTARMRRAAYGYLNA